MDNSRVANDKIRKAFEAQRKSVDAYRKLCDETFTPGTLVAWVVNKANGQYGQFGTVMETFHGTIRVRNNRTGKVIDMRMDSIQSYQFRKLTQEATNASTL